MVWVRRCAVPLENWEPESGAAIDPPTFWRTQLAEEAWDVATELPSLVAMAAHAGDAVSGELAALVEAFGVPILRPRDRTAEAGAVGTATAGRLRRLRVETPISRGIDLMGPAFPPGVLVASSTRRSRFRIPPSSEVVGSDASM